MWPGCLVEAESLRGRGARGPASVPEAQAELAVLFERLQHANRLLLQSWTWRSGHALIQALRLLLRLDPSPMHDHLRALDHAYEAWRQRWQEEILDDAVAPWPDKHEFPRGLLRVCVIPALHADGVPLASAYIRLLLPLTHSSLHGRLAVRISSAETLASMPGDILIVQRSALPDVDTACSMLATCRRLGMSLVLEMDDDLLALRSRFWRPGRLTGPRYRALIWLIAAADHVIVSTGALREQLLGYNPRVSVIPNALDESLWFQAGAQEPGSAWQPQPRAEEPVRIVYMGTRTHGDDLRMIAPVLRRVRRRYGAAVEIERVGGVVSGFSGLHGVFTRVFDEAPEVYCDFVPWLRSQGRWSIGLAPLADTALNRAKSGQKFLDYSAIGLVSLCSDLSPYRSLVRHRENGLLVANDPQSWFESLVELIEQPALRTRLARQAHTDVTGGCLLGDIAPYHADLLSELVREQRAAHHGGEPTQA